MKIAIVLATYKPDPTLLRQQLESLRAQTYRDWFLIVHDDQSTDLSILKLLVSELIPEGKFQVLQSPKRLGAVGNFSASLSYVPDDCQLIAFCDQDDEWASSKLEVLARYFEDSSVMAVHSDLSVIDRAGAQINDSCWALEKRDVNSPPSMEKLIVRNTVTGCSLVFRKELLAKAAPVPHQPLTQPYFFHDVWFALAALAQGRIKLCREPLVRYRQHGGNVVGAQANNARVPRSLSAVREKALRAFEGRRQLESAFIERYGTSALPVRLFTGPRDFGLKIFIRTLWWVFTSSRGYLTIGMQLAIGKSLWDIGFRRNKEAL